MDAGGRMPVSQYQTAVLQLWQHTEQLFLQVLELTPAEREAVFDQLGAEHADVVQAVQRLLAFDLQPSGWQSSVQQAALSILQPKGAALQPEQMLASYQIIRPLGRGGSSIVYLAKRADALFEQQVAIKLLDTNVADPALLHAFMVERQILADLEHPGISRLLDGGTTASGMPYLVMEYVQGQAIDDYCQQQALALTARLQLLVKVLNAVAYAHQKRVIHCDLAPANILITAAGEPKLLDFGIARLQRQSHSRSTIQGAVNPAYPQRLTKDYASPEQQQGLSLTTLTDVYSVGMVARKLLTDTVVKAQQLSVKAEQWQNLPQPRSSWLSWRQVGYWRRKHTVPCQLAELPTDLQWILHKATAVQPTERYQSVHALADDINRFLRQRMVRARPFSLAYQCQTFWRRNKAKMLVSAIFITLWLSLSWALWQYTSRLTTERDQALQQLEQLQQQHHDANTGQNTTAAQGTQQR